MEVTMKLREVLGRVTTSDLWVELANRLGVKFGRIQMAIHDGRPSKYVTLDMKVSTDDGTNSDLKNNET